MTLEPLKDRVEDENELRAIQDHAQSVRHGVARGALFMVFLRIALRGIGLVSTLILVRLLAPSDFGVVAMAMVSFSLLDLLGDLSLQPALVRLNNPERLHYDTAWTLGVIRGAVIALILITAAPTLATFFDEPRLILLSYALAGLAFLQNLENVRLADLHRGFRFELIFWYRLAGKAIAFVVCVALAYLLRTYWALVAGIAAGRITMVVLSYVIVPYWPRLSLATWRVFFHFSKWLMVTNVLWVVDANIMNVLIGRVSGAPALGTYQVANQIGSLPASEIAAPIRDPLYAGYARLLNDHSALRQYHMNNFGLLIAIIAPLSIGAMAMAEPITHIFLGPDWAAAVPLIRFCALYALFDAIGHFPREIYIALGHQRDFVMVLAVALLVRLPLVVTSGLFWGVNAAAAALAVSAALNAVLWNAFTPKTLGLTLGDFLQIMWRTIFACSVMLISVFLLLVIWPVPEAAFSAFWRFSAICIVGAAVHIVFQLTTWRMAGSPTGPETSILHFVRRAVGIQ